MSRSASSPRRHQGGAALALALVGTAAGSLAAAVPPASAAAPTAIRVGGPSLPADAKVALVGSAADLRGRPFRVLDGAGRVVLRGKLTAAEGKPAPWRRLARADLSRLRRAGSYRVRAAGLTSRPWVVRRDAQRAPIAAILQYFAANADGSEPSPVHGPAHLDDAVVASGPYAGQRFDLTGGWMDAGDMLKFTSTTAYATAALQAAARLDPADAPALLATADVGVRWLLKAHPAPGLFIAQVGDERDHDLGFRDPAGDDGSGKEGIATRFAYPNMGGDLGGAVALALAMAAARAPEAAKPALIGAAREWYAAGVAADGPSPKLPAPAGDFYTGENPSDALASGAAALYRVTGERPYLDDARSRLGVQQLDGRLGWNALAGFGQAELCGVLGAPAPDAEARGGACSGLGLQGGQAVRRSWEIGPFGTPGYLTWGQTGENGGAGAVAALAARAGSLNRGLDGRGTAVNARDWLLGRNPWGASFVAGYGPKSPRHPHHWASERGPGLPRGAVVGGPAPLKDILDQSFGRPRGGPFSTARATYEDRLEDYVTSEPAIDYAAGSILLLAALAAP
ncbi:glycoside hydrolase family 9 protein [Conexibacter sp. JD483]|uniref:glycoside hydrolase family 9 protein n=1 Tax=unclassified Conexibacter TaxID=2627773 RepID=UPI00271A7EB2|nr:MULTISPECIES: glycoside hydrolase family 9 protein [unclassified Conexibacter]MDO8188778.1 glycoside hydrolase family 9 protein [Conexibacter sp. CPCC 205706]MDO8201711.1 glycoside hydrolase family 9 protein [Conexibacter sp. CPCC 205762]MDR9371372.1 glycoside hydrolase family 9 protein [Conexibacter sp. JD483]